VMKLQVVQVIGIEVVSVVNDDGDFDGDGGGCGCGGASVVWIVVGNKP